MSQNKNKYFVVNQTTVVQALNKTEAEKLARRRTGRQVLLSDVAIDRIPAADARSMAASNS